MEKVYETFASKHTRTTAYHPATNGLTERFNKTLATMLSMFVDSSHSDWDDYLPYVCFAYNTSTQASTKYSPFFLLHGFEATLPSEVDPTTIGCDNANQYAELVETMLKEKRALARTNLEHSQTANKIRYDARHRPVIYQPGDKVMVYTPRRKVGRSEKLLHFYYGPYVVINRCGLNTYRVREDNNSGRSDIVHVTRMKPYRERPLSLNSDDESDVEDWDYDSVPIGEPQEELQWDHNSIPTIPEINWSDSDHVRPNRSETNISVESESDDETLYRFPSPVPSRNLSPVAQDIRRSQRVRKPPNRLTYLLHLSLFLFMLFLSGDCAFIKANPLIWRPATTPIVNGAVEVDVSVRYFEPFTSLTDALKGFNVEHTFMEHWCRQAYETSFLKPISKMCPDVRDMVESKNEIRQKRFIITGTVLLDVAAVSLFSSGIGTVGLAISAASRYEMNQIRTELERQAEQIRNLSSNQSVHQSVR